MAKAGRQRTIRTRAHFSAGDPAQDERELAKTLASLGLYAAHTTGDGNCLFRALADQFYGDHRIHDKVRSDICGYLEAHSTHFQDYVLASTGDDLAAGFASHVAGMRQNGTYGGQMELVAFSKMTGREIRVVQPGLVYVVADHTTPTKKARTSPPVVVPDEAAPNTSGMSARERRRIARDAKGKGKEKHTEVSDSQQSESAFSTHPLWIVYHSWEHFSSARNVSGPHSGLPLTEPRSLADAGSDGSTPGLTDDSDGDSETPNAEECLLLQSLPPDSRYATLSAARALLAKYGHWEDALEAAQQELHAASKRSASPTLPEGSSPRQRLREDSETDSSAEMTGDEAPPEQTDPGKPRSRRNSDRLAPPSSRETRAQMRHRLKQTNHRVTRSKALEDGIRTLRV